MKYLSTPKVQLAIFLFCFILANLLAKFSPYLLIYYSFTVILAVLVDYLFVWAKKIKPFLLSAAIATGLIVGLLNSPKNQLLEMFAIVVLAIASKHFIKLKGRHIFNPAAFGLFFGSLLFKTSVSWSGIANVLPLVLLSGYVSIFRSRKIYMILSFYAVYIFSTFFISHEINLLDPVLIFFVLIMLPEPMTSPNKPLYQALFGISAAVLSLILSRFLFVPDIFLGSLLFANLIFFDRR